VPTLSEAESKQLLAQHGIPVPEEALVRSPEDARAAAERIGYPVVAKLCGRTIAHKTERGLVRLGLRNADDVAAATTELLAAAGPDDGEVDVLIGAMVRGNRELIAGVVRDPQFGPCVMLGVGGILAEAVADVAFRVVPVDRVDAEDLIDELASQKLLGEFRGEPAVDRGRLVDVLVGLGQVAAADAGIRSIDLNPLIVSDGVPVAVDALVELDQ
jgi:acetyl-CoA synthetase (ADP-forming)